MPPAAGRSVSIHRSLLGNITLVIVVLGAAIVGLMLAGSRETVHRLTGVIVDQTIARRRRSSCVCTGSSSRWSTISGCCARGARRGCSTSTIRPA
jgi:hypothetical protein